jgi:hypothetical protein
MSVTADQPHQRSEHVVEAASELRFDLRNVAEGGGHREAREHLGK